MQLYIHVVKLIMLICFYILYLIENHCYCVLSEPFLTSANTDVLMRIFSVFREA